MRRRWRLLETARVRWPAGRLLSVLAGTHPADASRQTPETLDTYERSPSARGPFW